MIGSILKRVRHVCADGKPRWVQMPQSRAEAQVPPCVLCGTDVTRAPKGSVRYDCIWRAGGKQLSRTFDNKREADTFLATTVKDTLDGNFIRVRPTRMEEVFNRWLADSVEVKEKQGLLKPSTAKSYKSMLKLHLMPTFKDYRSDRLTAGAVAQWERKCADAIANGEMTAKTYNHMLALLNLILTWARKRGQRYLSHDPLGDLQRLRVPRVEREFLEPEEITRLIEAASEPTRTIITLAAYSGLRRGELFGLQWGDLDETAAVLRVRRSNYQGAITTPKTANSHRSVDLPSRIVTLLQEYRRSFPALEGDYVFRTETGTTMDPDNWYGRHFVPTMKTAKLRQTGLHALRHTYASLLINQGESIKYVSKQLGHASINITADLYGHLFKETSVSAMNRLSMRISGAVPAGNVVELPTGTSG